MMQAVIYLCLGMVTIAGMLALWRMVNGPTVPDRTIAFDMLAICILAIMVMLSLLWETRLFIEILMIYSLIGFVGTVVFVAYLTTNPNRLRDGARFREGDRVE